MLVWALRGFVTSHCYYPRFLLTLLDTFIRYCMYRPLLLPKKKSDRIHCPCLAESILDIGRPSHDVVWKLALFTLCLLSSDLRDH